LEKKIVIAPIRASFVGRIQKQSSKAEIAAPFSCPMANLKGLAMTVNRDCRSLSLRHGLTKKVCNEGSRSSLRGLGQALWGESRSNPSKVEIAAAFPYAMASQKGSQ
tara:strand:+ start:6993 stop:7313 length:321 start_codon:yes stop_codon:yes gene_type:complete